MLRILIDQDFDHGILRGLARRLSKIDFVMAFEVGLSEVEDRELLLRATADERLLLTQDRKTMPRHFAALLKQGEILAGVCVVARRLPIGQAIDELEIIISCSTTDERRNIIKILRL